MFNGTVLTRVECRLLGSVRHRGSDHPDLCRKLDRIAARVS
jgi:hypothetical protein